MGQGAKQNYLNGTVSEWDWKGNPAVALEALEALQALRVVAIVADPVASILQAAGMEVAEVVAVEEV